MRTFVRTAGVIVLLVFQVFVSSAQTTVKVKPETVGLSSTRLARIDRTVQSWVDGGKIAGAVTLIERRGKTAHAGVYGYQDREAKTPMREDTIFAIMSMTKPITSLAVLMLYEEGRFLLTDPISKYIPTFADAKVIAPGSENFDGAGDPPMVKPETPVTIRHLLLHTAGLSYGTGVQGRLYRSGGVFDMMAPEHTVGEFAQAIGRMPLLFQPGTKYQYSLSDDVLGYLVEVASGIPFEKFLEERIFKPLGMNDTFFYVPDSKTGRIAEVYRRNESGRLEKQPPDPKRLAKPSERRFCGGGGGLYSTVGDYARFCRMLLNGGELGGVRLVSPKTVTLLSTNGIGDIDPGLHEGGDKWGLGGVSVRTGHIADIAGMSPGSYMKTGAYTTYFWIDPSEKMFGIILMQLQPLDWDLMHYFGVLGTQAIID